MYIYILYTYTYYTYPKIEWFPSRKWVFLMVPGPAYARIPLREPKIRGFQKIKTPRKLWSSRP